ncbi:MAG: glycoside hydrolase family 32 protein [Caulobacteraceae bacterium]|nr:glycoside hydrolase family 32 protein [Caulobacteraceae bacterium]
MSSQRTPYRPDWHFTPDRNWINDPNGLIWFEGEYHLFFQYNPLGAHWGHMSWGHAVSPDLVHWRELPVAIPETEVMAFSGCAVMDEAGALAAVYTGHDPRTGRQAQYLARSHDRGRSWTRQGAGPVLDIGSTEFRDPKVFWHQPSRAWVMAVALAAENRIAFYRSPDLWTWRRAGAFGPAGARGRNWECPDLFELPVENRPGETRWVLAVNIGDGGVAGGSGAQYFVGDFDGAAFTLAPDWGAEPVWIDHGADFYAVASWSRTPPGDPRRIWIAWASNWRYAEAVPTGHWRGMMTAPRSVTLALTGAGYRIRQAPVRELETLRARPQAARDLRLGPAPLSLAPFGLAGSALELKLEVELGAADAVVLALSDEEGGRTLIGVDRAAGAVFLDRTQTGAAFHEGFPNRHTAPAAPMDGRVRLQILVDRSIVEIFVNDGRQTLTDLIFPAGALAWTAEARGGQATIQALETWVLRPAR